MCFWQISHFLTWNKLQYLFQNIHKPNFVDENCRVLWVTLKWCLLYKLGSSILNVHFMIGNYQSTDLSKETGLLLNPIDSFYWTCFTLNIVYFLFIIGNNVFRKSGLLRRMQYLEMCVKYQETNMLQKLTRQAKAYGLSCLFTSSRKIQ